MVGVTTLDRAATSQGMPGVGVGVGRIESSDRSIVPSHHYPQLIHRLRASSAHNVQKVKWLIGCNPWYC